MNKQNSIWGLIFCLLFIQKTFAFQEFNSDKPNIVIIFSDDHRYDAIGVLGNGQVKTPNIDKIIKGGTLFSNGNIQGANSGPV